MNKYCVLCLVGAFFLLVSEASAFSGAGAGTVGSPFQITTCDQLQEMQDDLGASYQLQNDIDCTATAGWNGGRGFVPVGTSSPQFTGNFNGRNYTIDKLYIERADDVYGENADDAIDEDYVGLFGFVNGSLIRNVKLTNAYVKGYRFVGGVVGEAQASSLENLHVNVATAVDPQNDCDPKACIWARYGSGGGGVVGSMINSDATHLTSGGAVKGSGNQIGGVVGGMTTSNLTYATSTAHIDGGYYIGGLVGALGNESSISYGVATGDVVGYEAEESGKNGEAIGGLVGYAGGADMEITNSSATGDVSGEEYVGGLIGYFAFGEISDSSATGDVTASSSISGGLVGYLSTATMADAYATGDVEGYDKVGGLVGLLRDSTLTDVYATGDVVATNFYAGGLVGEMGNSSIAEANATGDVHATAALGGGLIGVMSTSSSVTESFATGNVTGLSALGGFVGAACSDSSVTESYATGDVAGVDMAGGFLGFNCPPIWGLDGGATMDKVYATGDVEVTSEYAGGFAPLVISSTITNAYAAGRVAAPEYVGGFAVVYENSTSSNLYARGELFINSGTTVLGGLIATTTNSSITNSVWDSEATGVEDSAAGIGLTTTEMKTRLNYSLLGWNFSTVWGINGTNNESYPFLRFQGFTHDASYVAPATSTPVVSSGGGGGGGGGKKKVVTPAIVPAVATSSPTRVAPGGAGSSVQDLILKNRALFEQAINMGIVLPAFILDILKGKTVSVVTGLPVRDITVGMSGDDVKALQSILIAQGIAIPAGVTGLFGPQTRSALAAYQAKVGLVPAQGYFGAKTRAQMKGAGLSGLWW